MEGGRTRSIAESMSTRSVEAKTIQKVRPRSLDGTGSMWLWWRASRGWSVELPSSTMSRRLNKEVVELEGVNGDNGDDAGRGGEREGGEQMHGGRAQGRDGEGGGGRRNGREGRKRTHSFKSSIAMAIIFEGMARR